MWNVPSKKRLKQIPKLNETEKIKDKLIYMHFFLGSCDWWVAEFDGKDLFFGFAILNGDDLNSEWGYISFSELKALKVDGWCEVTCETENEWTIKKASKIENIKCY